MRSRRSCLWMVGAAVFFLNPALACLVDGDDFQFGAAEMRAAVEGTWQAELTLADGTPSTVTFTLAQSAGPPTAVAGRGKAGSGAFAPLLREASACTNRQLVRSAAACGSSTSMPLEGTFVSGDDIFRAATIRGDFWIHGLAFTPPATEVTLGLTDTIRLQFNLSPEGQATNVQVVYLPFTPPVKPTSATLVRAPSGGDSLSALGGAAR